MSHPNPIANTGLVQMMAGYNQWMNEKLYRTAAQLPEFQYKEDKGAFFGSVHRTLNHIMVADIIWLRRFSKHGSYQSLSGLNDTVGALGDELHADLPALTTRRKALDATIVAWSRELTDADLARDLIYTDMKGNRHQTPISINVMHLFNHGTHHRGQVTTLLSQFGHDVGVTDLAAYAREPRS